MTFTINKYKNDELVYSKEYPLNSFVGNYLRYVRGRMNNTLEPLKNTNNNTVSPEALFATSSLTGFGGPVGICIGNGFDATTLDTFSLSGTKYSHGSGIDYLAQTNSIVGNSYTITRRFQNTGLFDNSFIIREIGYETSISSSNTTNRVLLIRDSINQVELFPGETLEVVYNLTVSDGLENTLKIFFQKINGNISLAKVTDDSDIQVYFPTLNTFAVTRDPSLSDAGVRVGFSNSNNIFTATSLTFPYSNTTFQREVPVVGEIVTGFNFIEFVVSCTLTNVTNSQQTIGEVALYSSPDESTDRVIMMYRKNLSKVVDAGGVVKVNMKFKLTI